MGVRGQWHSLRREMTYSRGAASSRPSARGKRGVAHRAGGGRHSTQRSTLGSLMTPLALVAAAGRTAIGYFAEKSCLSIYGRDHRPGA
jgi:hypothetical protein